MAIDVDNAPRSNLPKVYLYEYDDGRYTHESHIRPERGINTSLDQLITWREASDPVWQPVMPGFRAPRWADVADLEVEAAQIVKSRLAFLSMQIIQSRTPGKQPVRSKYTSNPPATLTAVSTNKPKIEARSIRKTLEALGVTAQIDRRQETPTESDSSGSNYSETKRDKHQGKPSSSDHLDSDSAELVVLDKGKGKMPPFNIKPEHRMMVAENASKSSPLLGKGPRHVPDLFSGKERTDSPGRPQSQRTQDCKDLRDKIDIMVAALATTWNLNFATIWDEVIVGKTATSTRKMSAWNSFQAATKGELPPSGVSCKCIFIYDCVLYSYVHVSY